MDYLVDCTICDSTGHVLLESRITKGVFSECICGNCLGHGQVIECPNCGKKIEDKVNDPEIRRWICSCGFSYGEDN